MAQEAYPDPPTPRVVKDPEYAIAWRMVNGALQISEQKLGGPLIWTDVDSTMYAEYYRPTIARIELWMDLFLNPNESDRHTHIKFAKDVKEFTLRQMIDGLKEDQEKAE